MKIKSQTLIRYIAFCLIFFGCILFSGCKNTCDDPLSGFSSLSGNWSTYQGVEFSENWKSIGKNSMKGLGFSLLGKDTLFSENLKVINRNDSVFYRVETKSHRKPIDFLLKESSCHRWQFVNEDNNFPQLITYLLKNDTLLEVKISNLRNTREQYFILKRNID